MIIKLQLTKGTLNQAAYQQAYTVLRQIDCQERAKLANLIFDVGLNYDFEGPGGSVSITFETEDLNGQEA